MNLLHWFKERFTRVQLTQVELVQRQKTLSTMLFIALPASFVLSCIMFVYQAWAEGGVLFALSMSCGLGLWLNHNGHFYSASALLIVMAFATAHYSVVSNDRLSDSGLVSYPIIVTLGSLLLGKQMTPILTFVALASLSYVAYLEFIFAELTAEVIISNWAVISCLIMTTAAIIWNVINNNDRNLRRIKESEAEMRIAYESTLEGWAKVLELRDTETEGHSRRVMELSGRLAEALGCNETDVAHIRRGALLHDIGKIAIPDNILFKTGTLSPAERAQIEQHPILAKTMLEHIPFLRPALVIPYSHHEHWDGTGYPEGLRGEEIPLPARIFSVVDVWDALTSDRRYRKAWPAEKTASYLRKHSGTLFDSYVVHAFLKMLKTHPDPNAPFLSDKESMLP